MNTPMSAAPAPAPKLEETPQFPVLDTLRAVGALAVLTTHVTFQTGDYVGHGVWGAMLARLDIGVAIFFVLSGFLLSRPHLARAAAGRRDRPATGRYYWKRFLRIYPAYVVTVVIALALIQENAGDGPREWVRTLLLADTYVTGRLPQGLNQMWSLAAEVAFYLMLPLLMMAAVGRGRGLQPVRVAAVLGAMAAISVWWHLDLGLRVDEVSAGLPLTWLPAYLSWFAVGIGLALVHVLHQAGATNQVVHAWQALGSAPGACWTMAAGLMLVAATPLAGPTLLIVATTRESLFKNVVYAVIAGLVVTTGVFARTESRYARLMSARPLRHLGQISYSTFCLHLPVLHLVRQVTGFELFDGPGLRIWLLTAAISLVASEVLYRLVERPGMRLKNLGRPAGRSASQPSGSTQENSTR